MTLGSQRLSFAKMSRTAHSPGTAEDSMLAKSPKAAATIGPRETQEYGIQSTTRWSRPGSKLGTTAPIDEPGIQKRRGRMAESEGFEPSMGF